MSIREQILGADDIKREAVEVPEWGTTVYIKQMDGVERFQWAEGAFDDEGKPAGQFREKLLVRCLADEAGLPIFTDDDLGALGKKNGAVLRRLYNVALTSNALTAED